MIPVDVLLIFATASLLLAIAPGPDNIFVLTQSAMHGPRAGVLITLGLCTGLFVHIAAVAFGVAALLQASAAAFTTLKLLGAAWLLYLAWQAFRAEQTSLPADRTDLRGGRTLYLRGIIMNVSNPKVAIFFLAFLPQFVDPKRGPVFAQVVLLGLVFMLAALLVFCGIAWATGHVRSWWTRSRRVQTMINRLAGSVFILLAAHLVFDRHE